MPVEWPDGRLDSREWPLPPRRFHPSPHGRHLRPQPAPHGARTWGLGLDRSLGAAPTSPARVLDDVAPAMRSKGRLSPDRMPISSCSIPRPSPTTPRSHPGPPLQRSPSPARRRLLVIRDGSWTRMPTRPRSPRRAALTPRDGGAAFRKRKDALV